MTSTNFTQFRTSSSKMYKKGTMVFLQPISGLVGLAESTTIEDSDYFFKGDETNFALIDILSDSSYQYIELIVLTNRYYYENNQTKNLTFTQAGVYNLTAIVYDPLNGNAMLQKKYIVNGDLIFRLYLYNFY